MLIAFIVIVVLSFAFARWLDALNAKSWNTPLPEEAEGLYDSDKYNTAMVYDKENNRLDIISSSISFLITIILLWLGLFGKWYQYCATITGNYTGAHLLFFGSLILSADILGMPFELFRTFKIEEKYGFNKMAWSTFMVDKLKGYALGVLIGMPLLIAFIWFYRSAGHLFWLYAWIVISGVSIFMAAFYASFILPLFNKLTPLENGSLRSAIENYCNKNGFMLSNIMVMDGSKRSNKANAFFTGFGPVKKIVLFDTLISQHTEDELVAILAHEVGHYKHKHIRWSIILAVLQMGITLFIFSLFVNKPSISLALGGSEPVLALGILGFSILYTPLSLITGLAMNMLSRKNEYEADAFAATTFAAKPLIDALKKLSVSQLSNLNPHPLYVFFNFSHPTLLQRIRSLSKFIST